MTGGNLHQQDRWDDEVYRRATGTARSPDHAARQPLS